MKIKYIAALLVTALLITYIPLLLSVTADASAFETLGTITECVIDGRSEKIMIRGSVKHNVLVGNRDGKIAVYRFDPWINISSAVKTATPVASMDMTIRFEFDLPCTTIAHRMSLYAVAIIDSSGSASLIADPQYANLKSADTSESGFKTVITDDVAGAISSHPGSAVVDIYLDKLDKGNKSGYIFNADGELFYFDREIIKELDKKILSYTASGADVYLRFLISPYVNNLPFCTKGNLWATNKCVVVNNRRALNAIYAYTYFLISRYDGEDYGKVSGVILGKGADMPLLYNYAALVSENYEDVYARSLTLIGLAALEAAGDACISLIVPIGDTLTENRTVYASSFINSVAEYFESYNNLTFTIMCESRHNPYNLTDSFFASEIAPDDTGDESVFSDLSDTITDDGIGETIDSITTESFSESSQPIDETTLYYPETELIPDESSVDVSSENIDTDDTLSPGVPEIIKPQINKDEDGFYCSDNINVFLRFFNNLKKNHESVNDGFAWCWYPDSDTVEGALGVCYAYNYMKLAAVGADFYAVCFEYDVSDKFSGISHLFKYIDTVDNAKETEYARSVFEISEWSELIPEYRNGNGIYNNLIEDALRIDVTDYVGSLIYFDYSSGRGTAGWFDGFYCNSLGIQSENGESFLQADMDLDQAGVNKAEIGYMFKTPEPLLLGDALTFEIKCGEADSSLYEVSVYLRCGNSTIVSRTVIPGGEKHLLSLNASDYDNTEGVTAMKISLKRLTGSGGCKLNLYRVSVNSISDSDDDLANDLENLRDYLRPDTAVADSANVRRVIIGILLLASAAAIALFFAFGSDRKRYTPEDEKSAENINLR